MHNSTGMSPRHNAACSTIGPTQCGHQVPCHESVACTCDLHDLMHGYQGRCCASKALQRQCQWQVDVHPCGVHTLLPTADNSKADIYRDKSCCVPCKDTFAWARHTLAKRCFVGCSVSSAGILVMLLQSKASSQRACLPSASTLIAVLQPSQVCSPG